MDYKMKRGQVTIFIILGIVIVVATALIFFLTGETKPKPDKINLENPTAYIQSCAKEAIEPSLELVLEHGGVISPSLGIRYMNVTHNYLCYNSGDYNPCVVQIPMLRERTESELTKDSLPRIKECFVNLKKELEKKHYTIDEGSLNYKVKIVPNEVLLEIKKDLSITKEDKTQTYSDFSVGKLTKLSSLIDVAMDIVKQETLYCAFVLDSYMLTYPQFKISKTRYEGSSIYHVTQRDSNETFKLAIRGCHFPQGF